MLKKIVIIGSGNIAFHLIRAFLENSVNISQVFNRTLKKAEKLASNYNIRYTNKISELEKADLYIICTSDKAISEISYYIPYEDSLVVHTSGSLAMTALKGKYRKGVLYPLQTFSDKRAITYSKIPFLIEAENPEDQNLLIGLAQRVSKLTHIVNSAKRLKMHLAAVWINNFTNHIYYLASEICKKEDIPFDILKPLIIETANKIIDGGLSPFDAQTGPARRHDEITITKHLDILKAESDTNKYSIYQLLTQSIIKTYQDD